jgi:hypothetical protein
MPWVGFEPTISVFERAKIFQALDRTAIVIDTKHIVLIYSVCHIPTLIDH